MHGHNVRPGQAFAGQKLKFTAQLSDDQLLFGGLHLGHNKRSHLGKIPEMSYSLLHEGDDNIVSDVKYNI